MGLRYCSNCLLMNLACRTMACLQLLVLEECLPSLKRAISAYEPVNTCLTECVTGISGDSRACQ
jgi:hypothetical protein